MIDDYEIAETMIKYGGSFIHGLGKLFLLADSDNKLRLKSAFPEYWKRYEEIAKGKQK